MDKQEFNFKMDKIRKLVGEEDYATAERIADTIEWTKVKNTNLLSIAATVYEKNERLQDAKELLVLALERAPVGKRVLYKLTELSIYTGDLDEAEDYFGEYRELAGDDSSWLVLQYMLLKSRHAPYDQLLQPLEEYNSREVDEKWLYELATTYEFAGRLDDCIRTCDRIALLFGNSRYAVKALKLKQKYTGLTDTQKALVYPSSISGIGRVRTVSGPETNEVTGNGTKDIYDPYYGNDESYAQARPKEPTADDISEALAGSRYANEDEEFNRYAIAHGMAVPESEMSIGELMDRADARERAVTSRIERREAKTAPASDDITKPAVFPDPAASAETAVPAQPAVYAAPAAQTEHEAPASPAEAEETDAAYPDISAGSDNAEQDISVSFAPGKPDTYVMSGESGDGSEDKGSDPDTEETESAEYGKPYFAAKEEKPVFAGHTGQEVPKAVMPVPAIPKVNVEPAADEFLFDDEPEEEAKVPDMKGFHMIIEAETVEDGVVIAIDELKAAHKEAGISNQAVKTTAEKLNIKGLTDSIIERIAEKDLVIENAGALDGAVANQVCDFIKRGTDGTIVVMIDTPAGLDRLERKCPELFELCDVVSDMDDDYEEDEAPSYPETAAAQEDPEEDDEPVKEYSRKVKAAEAPGEEMEHDDFAQYCFDYANEIDCSITGKSMLALHERIELMEEDGIPLTKANAVDLIEEVADRAEKPPLGKRISGMFRSKYDKDGKLILKEEDFIP